MSLLSLAQLTVDPAPIHEMVAAAAKARYDAVNLRVRQNTDKGPSLIPMKELKSQLADGGLSVLSLTSFWITPETVPGDIRSLAEAGSAFGAPFLQSAINDPDEARALSNFSRACEIAAEYKLRVAIEFLGYLTVPSLGATLRFIKASGQNNAGVCLDALALFRANETAADVAAADPNLMYYMQMCDGPRQSPPHDQLRTEARGLRLYPGEGELPLAALMDALPKDIPIDVEIPVAASATLSAEQKAQKAADKTRQFLENYRKAN